MTDIFIPRLLLCGDKEEFFSRVGQRLFELVGEIQFSGEANGQQFDFLRDGKFLLGDKLFAQTELSELTHKGIDFLIFNDAAELKRLHETLYRLGCPRSQVVTLREFNHLPTDGFHDMQADVQLLVALKNSSVRTLLDVDAHFAKGFLLTKQPNDFTAIDCVCNETFWAIKENIYNRVYKNFSECALKHYDAALIAERSPASFDETFAALRDTADLVITFARNGSALAAHIQNIAGTFAKVNVLPSSAGAWLFCQRRTPPVDFAMYVVTHKALPPEHVQRLPAGYTVIHAGRALHDDLGYLGDDTGDNISDLNPYLNELTALYWMWKNTSHAVIGLNHYRRFFTTNRKNLLTCEEVTFLLQDYDIITDKFSIHPIPTYEVLRDNICNDEEIFYFSVNVIRKHLSRAQPDYLDAFDYKLNSATNYYKNMFVTRRSVFNVYCQWLFSFLIDATREILNRTLLSRLEGNTRRLMGHFAERLMTVWLMKNRLRVKEIGIVQMSGL